MEMKIVGVTLAAFVSLVVLAAVLVPILDDATATTDTYTNEGYFYMTEYGATDTIPTIFWDHTDPNKLTVGTDVIELPTSTAIPISVVFTDDWLVRYSAGTPNSSAQLFTDTGGVIVGASTSNNLDMTITFSSGTATVTNGTDSATPTYTKLMSISTTGDYVMKKSTVDAYVNGDTEVFVTGRSAFAFSPAISANIDFSGSIDDGFSATIFNPSTGFTTGNFATTYTEVSDHDDLYKLSKVTFDVTKTEDSTVQPATYSQFVVPAEVTAERAEHLSGNQIELMQVIPVLIIVAILIGVVALVIRSRLD